MSNEIENTTETKILAAAEIIFLRDGYAGSRMQDIADTAGINKAMLHYYFRNKDKLFEQIFEKNKNILFPLFKEILEGDYSFIETINFMIEKYYEVLKVNPFIPLFIMNAVNDPQKASFLDKLPYQLIRKLAEKYIADFSKGIVKQVNPFQFIISVLGMCFFPFMAKPIIKKAIVGSGFEFDNLMEQRVSELKSYVSLILKP